MWMDWVLYEMSEHPPSLLLSVHLVQEGSGVSGNGHGRALDHGAGWRSGRHAGRLLLPPLGFFLLQPLFSHLTPIHGGVGTWPGGNTDGVLVLCSVMYNVPSTDAAIEVIIIETTQKNKTKEKKKTWTFVKEQMHQKPLIRIKMFTALNFHTENSSCDMVLHLRQQRQHSLGLWCPHSRRRGRWCGGRMLMVSVWGLWGAAGILGRGYGLLLARCGVRVAGRHHGRGHRLLGRCEHLEKTGKEGMGNISGPSFDSMN